MRCEGILDGVEWVGLIMGGLITHGAVVLGWRHLRGNPSKVISLWNMPALVPVFVAVLLISDLIGRLPVAIFFLILAFGLIVFGLYEEARAKRLAGELMKKNATVIRDQIQDNPAMKAAWIREKNAAEIDRIRALDKDDQ